METLENTLPKIDGADVRYYQGKEDHPAMIEMYNLIAEHADVSERETEENFDANYANLRNCNPYEDVILAEVGGQLAATARVAWYEEMDGTYVYPTIIAIHPDWHGTPLAEAMLDWAMGRARQISAGHPAEVQKFYQGGGSETQTARLAMLERYGYEPVRYWYEMYRDLSQPIPEVVMPEGLEVRPVTPEHYRLISEAADEAFRDHWGHVDDTEEDFQRWVSKIEKGLDGYKPEYWMVAWEGDQVAGMVLNSIFEEENRVLGVKRGWTDPICVRRQWRKRGLATALINKSLAMMKEMGLEEGGLGVDTINPSGALRLYENCGFVDHQKWVTYRKPF